METYTIWVFVHRKYYFWCNLLFLYRSHRPHKKIAVDFDGHLIDVPFRGDSITAGEIRQYVRKNHCANRNHLFDLSVRYRSDRTIIRVANPADDYRYSLGFDNDYIVCLNSWKGYYPYQPEDVKSGTVILEQRVSVNELRPMLSNKRMLENISPENYTAIINHNYKENLKELKDNTMTPVNTSTNFTTLARQAATEIVAERDKEAAKAYSDAVIAKLDGMKVGEVARIGDDGALILRTSETNFTFINVNGGEYNDRGDLAKMVEIFAMAKIDTDDFRMIDTWD